MPADPTLNQSTPRLTLATVCDGVAEEKFAAEFQRVLQNVLDPNTDAEKKREITLKFTVIPNEERDAVRIVLDASSKVAATKGAAGVAFIGIERSTGEAVATVYSAKQLQFNLDQQPAPKPTVLPKNKAAGE